MQIKVEITRRENAEYFDKKIGDIVTVDMVDYMAAVGASEFASAGAEAAKAQAIAHNRAGWAVTLERWDGVQLARKSFGAFPDMTPVPEPEPEPEEQGEQ